MLHLRAKAPLARPKASEPMPGGFRLLSCPHPAIEVAVSAPTTLLPACLVKDLAVTLSRLRMARLVNDEPEVRVSERRLNWLIDTKIPRR